MAQDNYHLPIIIWLKFPSKSRTLTEKLHMSTTNKYRNNYSSNQQTLLLFDLITWTVKRKSNHIGIAQYLSSW